jgi:hypothetical protein
MRVSGRRGSSGIRSSRSCPCPAWPWRRSPAWRARQLPDQDGRFQDTGIYRLVLPDKAALPKHTQVIGRGPCLHFLTGDDWYQLTMSDLPPQPHS